MPRQSGKSGRTVVVVDSSAVLDVLLGNRSAPALRKRFLKEDERLQAPHLIDLEVLQVIRRHARFGDLDVARARIAIDDHRRMPIERHRHDSFLSLIWQLRNNFTAYDAVYVALGIALNATLITADTPLARAAESFLPVEVFA
jgi:predicted nucleic acid-binding protein